MPKKKSFIVWNEDLLPATKQILMMPEMLVAAVIIVKYMMYFISPRTGVREAAQRLSHMMKMDETTIDARVLAVMQELIIFFVFSMPDGRYRSKDVLNPRLLIIPRSSIADRRAEIMPISDGV